MSSTISYRAISPFTVGEVTELRCQVDFQIRAWTRVKRIDPKDTATQTKRK
jgi:hypothetical protein